MMRRLQETQRRGTQSGGILHVPEIPSLNLHKKTGYRIQIFAVVYSSSSEIVSTDYEIFFSDVTSRLRSWPLYNLKQLTEQFMGRYRMFVVSWHWPWQHYRIERIHPPKHLVTAAVLRRGIKETHCLLYRLSDVMGCQQMASSQKKIRLSWTGESSFKDLLTNMNMLTCVFKPYLLMNAWVSALSYTYNPGWDWGWNCRCVRHEGV